MAHPRIGHRALPHGLKMLHDDRDILVVNKPAGLLTMGTEREKERTAYYILMDYVRKGNSKSRQRVFIVHRLDKDTSGVLLLAKSGEAKRYLQGQWEETEKRYLAVVHGHLEQKTGILSSFLAENSAGVIYSTPSPSRGKLARTQYRVLRELKEHSVLEIQLLTGRKHQIRVQLADLGHPVAGDKKYGVKKDSMPRLALHACSLAIHHPHSGERLEFHAPPPAHFTRLAGSWEIIARLMQEPGEKTSTKTP